MVLALNMIGGTTSLLLDHPWNWHSFHATFEVTSILLSLTGTFVLWQGWWRTAHDLGQAQTACRNPKDAGGAPGRAGCVVESEAQVLAGLGQAIDRQFRAWRLTRAEREVALLLLQGHGHKGIGRTDRA